MSDLASSGLSLKEVLGIEIEEKDDKKKKKEDVVDDTRLELKAKPLDPSSSVTARPDIPSISASAVLGESMTMPKHVPIVQGIDFDQHIQTNDDKSCLDDICHQFVTTGFQATNVGLAIEQINAMRRWRLSDVPYNETLDRDERLSSPEIRQSIRARIFLAFTSNQISSGQREVLKFLVKHSMVDCIVTTAGGIEEDLMKCMAPTYMGDFALRGAELRRQGINRIGNLLVPNQNYCLFENWFMPLLHKMHDEQDRAWEQWHETEYKQWKNNNNDNEPMPEKFVWTPSSLIHRLGLEINDEDSVLYWASRNNIPIFCPALTDGSIGDMIYFHSYKRSGFVLDIAKDVRRLNDFAVQSHATGMIILGGGLVKHHTCNANLMRNGADFCVYINTSGDFDGSDTGASPEEAKSWGKIRPTAKAVKVYADATIVFPLIVSQTFAKNVEEWKQSVENCVCWIDDL